MKLFKEIGRNAQIDWIIVLMITVGVCGALAFGGIYLYNAVTAGNIQDSNSANVSKGNLDTKALSQVVDEYAARAEAYKRVKAGYTGPSDPSI